MRWTVRTVRIVNPGQVDILKFDKASGKAPLYGRPLTLEIWYPAAIPEGKRERTDYDVAMPAGSGTFHLAGKSLRDAAPVSGKHFPLVVVSHGHPGSRLFMSFLSENLASKGYVTAAIDHTDSVFGEVKGFPSTLLNRANDQLFTIQALEELSRRPDDFLHGVLDAAHVAIVGNSMGGYGVLASAGAGYSKKAAAAQAVPGGYFDEWTEGSANFEARRPPNLKVIVAIAPWGAQPPYNSWDAAGLAGIRIPSLFIAGDKDDVSDFEHGIRPAFEGAVNSERCLLVFENAHHNTGGNPAPPEAMANFATLQFFDEPVWRKDRIAAIDQHFITAFLDLYLKGDESRRAYLHPAVEKSNDGRWPVKQGESTGAVYSDGAAAEGRTVWKGFQRRWDLGLEMRCYAAGRTAN